VKKRKRSEVATQREVGDLVNFSEKESGEFVCLTKQMRKARLGKVQSHAWLELVLKQP
jgi:hypothetical protein